MGVQANLWTEYAPTPERAEYDLMPRLAAAAEVAWGTAGSPAEFHDRLRAHVRRLDAAGIAYRPLR
jgi:hexosaminidase